MHVLVKIGRNAGKVIDVRADQARTMIEDGRAVKSVPEDPKPVKKKRGRGNGS